MRTSDVHLQPSVLKMEARIPPGPFGRLIVLLTQDPAIGIHVRIVEFDGATGFLTLTIGVHRGEVLEVELNTEVMGFTMHGAAEQAAAAATAAAATAPGRVPGQVLQRRLRQVPQQGSSGGAADAAAAAAAAAAATAPGLVPGRGAATSAAPVQGSGAAPSAAPGAAPSAGAHAAPGAAEPEDNEYIIFDP